MILEGEGQHNELRQKAFINFSKWTIPWSYNILPILNNYFVLIFWGGMRMAGHDASKTVPAYSSSVNIGKIATPAPTKKLVLEILQQKTK
jgi:hypothetical protein